MLEKDMILLLSLPFLSVVVVTLVYLMNYPIQAINHLQKLVIDFVVLYIGMIDKITHKIKKIINVGSVNSKEEA